MNKPESNDAAERASGSLERVVRSPRQKYLEWAKRITHEASEASLKAGYAHKEKKSDRLFAYSENVDWDS